MGDTPKRDSSSATVTAPLLRSASVISRRRVSASTFRPVERFCAIGAK
jgi:hypothetical protein